MAKIPLAQDPNESREKNCGVREVGVGGRAVFSLTELAIPNISQINVKNFLWIPDNRFQHNEWGESYAKNSLSLTPAKEHTSLVHSIHGNVSKVQTWLGYISFSNNIEKEGELFF